jgi:pyruvate-ferredoxin/flavodoxin oxidoreductase
VTAEMMAGRGDELPVSALPVDGTYPSGTTAYEKRNISELVAVWDPTSASSAATAASSARTA